MTFHEFIQKTCIWVLSLSPFAYMTHTYLRGFGANVTVASFLAISYCIVVLGLCMYLAEQWCTLWNIQDAEYRRSGIDLNTLRPSPPLTQSEIAERIAQGRVAEMSLHAAGME